MKWGDGMDLISREALKELLQHKRNSLQGIGGDEYALKAFDYCIKRINEQPTIEAVPVVHGEWIESEFPEEKFCCSVCGGACWYYDCEGEVARSRFCPNCGAKMDRKKV